MRLAFAVAIHVDAEIPVIDEVPGESDQNFFEKCSPHIDRVPARGQDPDLRVAFAPCDRIAVRSRPLAGPWTADPGCPNRDRGDSVSR